ncbi:MAG: hypothetical protein PHW02_01780 [bacterium]|nr:hypothetical protein [bacterium]
MKKAWILSVDMGYGHQRAAYPLSSIAQERIMTVNTDHIESWKERMLWRITQSGYESVSRMKALPIIGNAIFGTYDKLQDIAPFYPFNVNERPNGNVTTAKNLIKMGLCGGVLNHVSTKDLPIITTHFMPSLAADYNGFEKIYSVITDTDINRVWVSAEPKKSNITFLSPSRHAAMRLIKYGVPPEKIYITGFPLPKENIGGENQEVLKRDLARRVRKLDPHGKFLSVYGKVLDQVLGEVEDSVDRPLTICFMVGGAGAQADIGIEVVKSLETRIRRQEVRVNLVAGIRTNVKEFFEEEIKKMNLEDSNKCLRIIYAETKDEYFRIFNEALHETDILWTKPSEMSFYTALGIPIIIAPPVGAHEEFNDMWIRHIGSGFTQEEPKYANDWLFYVLESGRYAQAAFDGYMRAPTMGTYRVEAIINGDLERAKEGFTDAR